MTRHLLIAAVLTTVCTAQDLRLPNKKDSFRFAVLGDTGTGSKQQYQVAEQVALYRQVFPFDTAILLGDNIYGGEKPRDYESKFERPYATLLKDGVKFYAALGNHDDPGQRNYKHFNMNGQRYYTFKPATGIRFFALDSNYMERQQIEWLDKELADSSSNWKIAFFHHPLYSSGEKHGPDEDLRRVVEPLLLKHGASVVFAGHEHFYERLKPQKGILHFVAGGSAKLREGNIRKSAQTAVGFDKDNTFMLCEIDGDQLHYQTITRTGRTVDSGVFVRTQPALRSSAGNIE